jgi:hypothetical protein
MWSKYCDELYSCITAVWVLRSPSARYPSARYSALESSIKNICCYPVYKQNWLVVTFSMVLGQDILLCTIIEFTSKQLESLDNNYILLESF